MDKETKKEKLSFLIASRQKLLLKDEYKIGLDYLEAEFLSFDRIYDNNIFEAFSSYYMHLQLAKNRYIKHLTTRGVFNERIYCLSIKLRNTSCNIEELSNDLFLIENEFGQVFESEQLQQCFVRKGSCFSVKIPPNFTGVFKFYYVVPDDDFEYDFVMNFSKKIYWVECKSAVIPYLKGLLDKSESLSQLIESGTMFTYEDCMPIGDNKIVEFESVVRIVSFRQSTAQEKKLMYRDKYGYSFINDKQVLDAVSLYTMELKARSPYNYRERCAIPRCPIVIYDDYYYAYRGYNIFMYNRQNKPIETYVFALPNYNSNHYVLCYRENKKLEYFFDRFYLEKIQKMELCE